MPDTHRLMTMMREGLYPALGRLKYEMKKFKNFNQEDRFNYHSLGILSSVGVKIKCADSVYTDSTHK